MSILTAYLILTFALGMLAGLLSTNKFTDFLREIYFRQQDKKRQRRNRSRFSTKIRSP